MIRKTQVVLNTVKNHISLKDNIFSVGSCFSNEISKYLKKNGIYVYSNPFGTIYNVHSIYLVFKRIFEGFKSR